MRRFLVVAMAGLSLSVFGETYTWTGAVDSYWTNRANWTVGGAAATEFPGVATTADHFNGDGTLTDKGRAALGATAVFGALAAGGATTVDLDGLYSIGNVTVASGAPAYTFGTSADQVLPLESRATAVASANLFLIEEGAELPVFVAGLSFGSAQEGTGRTYLRIKNCVAGTQLVLPSVGHTRILPGNAKGNPWVMFDGVGGFRFEGPFEDIACYSGNNRQYPDILFYGTGKITVATEMFGGYKTENYCLRQFYNEAGMTLEILEDCTFFPVSHYNFEMPITVNGSGTLGFDGGSYVLVSPAKTATINCDFEVMRSSESLSHDFKLYSWAGKDAGTLNMYGTVKGLTGTFTMDTPSTYRVNKVANFGEGANVVFMRPGVFDYAGAEADAAFGKSISIAAACTPTFSNSGSTELVVSSEISATVTDAGFAFAPATGPIRFTGSFVGGNAIGLVKNGTGKLAFSTDVGNVARTTLNGGEVEVFRGRTHRSRCRRFRFRGLAG